MPTRRGAHARLPPVGTIVTGTVVGEAKRGVQVELGVVELVLPRTRWGAAGDRIATAGFGAALTVEVVADPSHPRGIGLSRTGIERSVRQPRPIAGRLRRRGAGFDLAPDDGSEPFAVEVLDRHDPESIVDEAGVWLVGAPHRGRRFVLVDDEAAR